MSPPPLSTILATKDPWPHAREALDSLVEASAGLGGEVVLADGDGAGLPAAGYRGVVWLRRPGASVFELRALAVAHARGEIVATTEDHCSVAPDWGEAVLASHRSEPRAGAVAGPVANGATATLADWANFLMTFASFMAPLRGHGDRIPPPPALSYKRAVLPGAEPPAGWLEFELNPGLARERRIALDDRPATTHTQHNTLAGHLATHFHNARTTTGSLADGVSWRGRRRLLRRHLGVPWALTRSTMAGLRARRRDLPRRAQAAIPLVPLLCLVTGAGQVAGIVAGPGRSPLGVD